MKLLNFIDLITDLERRDITINSIAFEEDNDTGTYLVHDYFGGQDDIQNKILRHTSNAFKEDPVRVLRIARFRARLGNGWTVAPETKKLIHSMVKDGTLNELNSERVWKEMSRALMEETPRLFFDTLLECDCLHVLFPEVYKLKTALESFTYHPEGDAYEHTMLVLTQAALFNFNLTTRLASLVHDFGKGLTPRHKLPKHYGHDVNGVEVVEEFCKRLSVPTKMRVRCMYATLFHMNMHRLDKMNPKTFAKMFEKMGSLNDPETVKVLHDLGVCDERGRLGSENAPVEHLNKLNDMFDAYKSVKFADVFPNGETNTNKIKSGMYQARINAMKG